MEEQIGEIWHRLVTRLAYRGYPKAAVRLSERLAASLEYERNLRTQSDLRKAIGLTYTAQCWSAELRYQHEDDEHSFELGVNLHGLGDF